MPSTIRLLDEQTINKIAAGEVIENPSSVVKELVDNALDASATEITVEIRGGGRQLIRVTDNGSGMTQDDALLSLERHATSKLKDIEDIHHLDTFGFRGEAIPSIASISKFSILTCEEGKDLGTFIIVEGGKILTCREAPCQKGTQIEISNLFFNVPVRKKFQRSPTFDATEIQKVLTHIALANQQVKFRYLNNGSLVFSANEEERLAALLGEDFSTNVTPIDEKKGPYHLKGFIGYPTFDRPNRQSQYLFVNKRPVNSNLVSYSVKEGYGTTLTHGRHPVFCLYLEMEKELVDINVHPQKKERQVFLLIRSSPLARAARCPTIKLPTFH
jgi:DNA mismatch repair protein MutL